MNMLHLIIDILRNSILITGLVIIMMMLIESLNIESRGLFFSGLRKTRIGQVIFSALLGSIPGCMGGFASVSLYTHRMISFGALVAMMIASSGDEAFMIMAMIPDKAMLIFTLLFGTAVITGILIDFLQEKAAEAPANEHSLHHHRSMEDKMKCEEAFEVHEEEDKKRTFTWKRALMFIGVAVFIAVLASGMLEHSHGEEAGRNAHTALEVNLLSEEWMHLLFAGLSLIVLAFLIFASDHFIEEHLWHHIIRKHLLSIFGWTVGVLSFIGIGLHYIDISEWINSNTALMIILATVVGIIPESGPHMIFVTLYATGIVPLPVLLASSISQDGHASIPLLAESKKSFAKAKLINCAVALIVGFGSMLFM